MIVKDSYILQSHNAHGCRIPHYVRKQGFVMMRYGLLFLFCSIVFADMASSQEVLVPLDTLKRIDRIDEETDLKLHLFTEYKGFSQAFLFRLPDSTYAFEVWYRADGRILKSRTLMSASEARRFQQRIAESLRQLAPMAGIDQSGRPIFLGGAYTLSIGVYGWGIPYLLGLDGSVAIGSYLLISAGGILIAHAATERMEISEATANLSFYGSMMGLAHGVMIAIIVRNDESMGKGYVSSAMIFSTLEGILGFQAGKKLKLSGGGVEMLGTMSGAGLLYGWGASSLMDLSGSRPISTTMLIGSIVGTAAGLLMVSDDSYTNGDVGVIRGTAMLGAYVPLSILIAAHVNGSKAYIGTAMAGGILGGTIGNYLVKNKDFTTAEGTYIMFGAFGGMLIGGGIPLLAGAENGEVAAVLSGAGALAGFAWMYHRYAPSAGERAASSSLSFQLYPEGLAAMSMKPTLSFQNQWTAPIVSFSYRF